MFANATKRRNADYVMWPNPEVEHPTQCYPSLPLWRYPNEYKVIKQCTCQVGGVLDCKLINYSK